MTARPIIWVEGIIAAGKSRLTNQLQRSLGFRAFPEPVADQGYLELFYEDPKRWAFPLQIEMLRRRWDLHRLAMLECRCGNVAGCVLDRGLPGDRVFAWLHYQAGNIHKLEWQTYEALYAEAMTEPRMQPHVLVYLDVSPVVALGRIEGRGRPGERAIRVEYLEDLQEAYRAMLQEIVYGNHPWAHGMRVLEVPWSDDNLPTEPIVSRIREELADLGMAPWAPKGLDQFVASQTHFKL
jgi:deoxyadenosine/deoxycytidine kinase